MPGSNNNGSSSSSSSGSSAKTAKSKAANKAAKAAARATRKQAVKNNVQAQLGEEKLTAVDRAKLEKKLLELRENSALNSAKRAKKEAKLFEKVREQLAERRAEKAAKEAARAAEVAARSAARTEARTAARQEKERAVAQAKANLKDYLGKSPKKKNVNAFYKARKNTRNMTAKNFAKAAGIRRTAKLSESAKKLQERQKKVGKDFIAKGVDSEEFCEKASAFTAAKNWLEAQHKEKGLKHSLSTIVDVCTSEIVRTPNSSASAGSS